jgi:endo-1,3-1,4-beta-glycanase ExoK
LRQSLALLLSLGCVASAACGSAAGSGGSASGSGGGSGVATGNANGGNDAASSGGSGAAGSAIGSGGSGVAATGGSGKGGTGSASGDDGGIGPAGVLGHPDPTITYSTHPGYTLYLAEEFDNPIDLDNDANWTWSDGALSEGSVRFEKSQITFSSTVTDDPEANHHGYMILTADNTPAGLVTRGMSWAENGTIGTEPQISGEFRTKYNNYRYGWYEARYKAPPTTEGNYIASLVVFRTPKTISWREIDVELTPDMPAKLGTNVYWENITGTMGMGYLAQYADVGSDPLPAIADHSQTFHVYAVEWMPTYVKWWVDGQLVRTKDAMHGNNPNVAIPEKSTKILMNLWVFGRTGGFGGNDPSTNAYPMKVEYDYFRFYRAAADTTYPCAPTPACVTHDDNIRSKNNPNDGVTFNAK